MAFAHLHTHSQYTLLDGAVSPAALAARAAALGQPALALTDRCNLYGAVEVFKACKAAEVHPVIGSEIAIQPEGIEYRDPRGLAGGWSLVLLVQDEQGYRNLCRLITGAIFDGMHYRPRADLAQLEAHAQGLIALSGGLKGLVGRAATLERPQEARQQLEALLRIFGRENLFLELQDYGLQGQPEANQLSRELAAEAGLDTVVTNPVHYLRPEDVVTQDVLHAIAWAEALDSPKRHGPQTDQLYFKEEAELREVFPQDSAALERSVELAARCQFEFSFGKYHFPATTPPDTDDQADSDANWAYFFKAFAPPKDFGLPGPNERIPPRVPGAGNLAGYFRWYATRGLQLRLEQVPAEQHSQYQERLERELGIIIEMEFPAYLLIVAEFINWAKDCGIPVGPGRGSAAGSLVAWAMRITDVDPIRFTLLFERFLNPERVSMPDIDVDFCQDRREEVIEHVRQKYGSELVAQIITYGKLKAKLAIRDVARVASLTFNDADRIAKLVPNDLKITIDKALDEEKSFRGVAEGDPKVRRVVSLARRIEGMTRQTGVHAAGVVIADKPLTEYAPLYRDGPEGGPVVQYEMKAAEGIGLIKFDFLGLKTLDQIRDAVELVRRNTGEEIDISRIPLDDPAAFKLLSDGDSLGVFQVESDGMQRLLIRLEPQTIDEAIALIALYRPGPLQSGMVDRFVERKHGREPISYALPQLEPILNSTYGVVLYQEQVMQVAQVLAGYRLGEADLLRRAMGKKKAEEMDKQRSRFLSGAEERGIDPEVAESIFQNLAKFAAYGFNKSHSAAYGLIAYQTAWLKAHHRAEYMAALMSIEADNTDKVLTYINDCRRAGLPVLPPDTNQSLAGFDVPAADRGSIRFGLTAVKNVGSSAVDAIIQAREQEGSFRDLSHLLESIDLGKVNKRMLEALIRCGAFDWTGATRASLAQGLDGAMKVAQQAQETRASGQVSLFGGPATPLPSFRFPVVPAWAPGPRLAYEREALGFYISGHPLDAYGDDLKRHVTCGIDRIHRFAKPATKHRRRNAEPDVTVAGIVTAKRAFRTKRGSRMGFVTLNDRSASVECTFFADAWESSRKVLESQQPILVRGNVERKEGSDDISLLATSAELVSELLSRRTREVRIALRSEELDESRTERLLELFQRHAGPCGARIHLRYRDKADVVLLFPPDRGVLADDTLRDELEALFGRPDAVRFM